MPPFSHRAFCPRVRAISFFVPKIHLPGAAAVVHLHKHDRPVGSPPTLFGLSVFHCSECATSARLLTLSPTSKILRQIGFFRENMSIRRIYIKPSFAMWSPNPSSPWAYSGFCMMPHSFLARNTCSYSSRLISIFLTDTCGVFAPAPFPGA